MATLQIAWLEAERDRFVQATRAENTHRAYAYDWKKFESWCRAAERGSLPASDETVALYLVHLIGEKRRVSTAARALATIRYYHRLHALPSPVNDMCRAVIAGARRVLKERPEQKLALSIQDLRRICQRPAVTRIEVRNRALILFGFSTALRRVEIARLELADVEFRERGMLVYLKWEKQDQEGKGRTISVCCGQSPETCPVAALRAWIEVRGERPGALFYPFRRTCMLREHMSTQGIADVVKAELRRIGLDARLYGCHSLRAGFITAAGLAGASELNIARHTGHRSMAVLRRYFRARDPFESAVSGIIGL